MTLWTEDPGRPQGSGSRIRCVRGAVPTCVDVQQLIREQDGLITREQARSAGLTDAMIDYRVTLGRWTPVRPMVFLSSEHRMTSRARLRADALWLGPEATLTGVGAVWWWRLIDSPPRVSRFAVAPGRRVRNRPTTATDRCELPAGCRVKVDGLMVTGRARAVVDAVRELGLVRGADVMDRALLDEHVTMDGLREAHADTIGRRGSPTVARLLRLAAGGARFEAERRIHRLLHAAGIGGWAANHAVTVTGYGRAVLDIAFTEQRVLIEIDGWAYHRDPEAFRRDRRRQNALMLAGWVVLRVTWHDIIGEPERVLAEICAALTHDR